MGEKLGLLMKKKFQNALLMVSFLREFSTYVYCSKNS